MLLHCYFEYFQILYNQHLCHALHIRHHLV
nr:MAG TPA: hypothetical protein [Caudoviricetes sp.]